MTPSRVHEATASINLASSQTVVLAGVTGDAVYLFILYNSAVSVSSVSDGVNSYSRKATYAGTNGTVDLWVADAITGGSLSILVQFSGNATGELIALDITGQAASSFGSAGTGTTGAYTSGTSETASVTPSSGNALLLLGFGIYASGTSGTPTITWATVSGETLEASGYGSNAGGHNSRGGGIYSKAASGTGSQALTGNATLAGGASSADWFAIAVAVLPGAQATAAEVGLALDAASKAGSLGAGEIGARVRAAPVASSKGKGAVGLSLSASVSTPAVAAAEVGLHLGSTLVAGSKGAGELGTQVKAAPIASSVVLGKLSVDLAATAVASSEAMGEFGLSAEAEGEEGQAPGLRFSAMARIENVGGGGWADYGETPPVLSAVDLAWLRPLPRVQLRRAIEELGFVSLTRRPDGSERPLEEIPDLVRANVRFEESAPPETRIVYVDRAVPVASTATGGPGVVFLLLLVLLLLLAD